jgi:hypothetical protein
MFIRKTLVATSLSVSNNILNGCLKDSHYFNLAIDSDLKFDCLVKAGM